MELKIVPYKAFKRIFFNFLAVCLLLLAGGLLLYKMRINIFPASLFAFSIKNVFVFTCISIALIFIFFAVNNKKELLRQKDFESRIAWYEKYYTRKLWWHVISVLSSVIFLLLTFHYIFLYFALFDLLSLFSSYPSKETLKNDLNENDLLFN